MVGYFLTASSGWIAAALVGTVSLLPYLLRRTALSRRLGLADGYRGSYLARMWPHYWLGYGVIAVSTVHAYLPMSAGHIRGTSATGLWLATIALGLLCLQALLGLTLREPGPAATRRTARRWHFWGMLGSVVLVVIHFVLNG
jgi:hypothetical protein